MLFPRGLWYTLGVVHGIFHKSDLSLDAVIKFFAAGFIIATPTAFVVEAILLNILLGVFYIIATLILLLTGDDVMYWFENHIYVLLFIADIVQSFLIAGAAEECCKYFAFRTIEHPDLIFLTSLDKSKQDRTALAGGHDAYASAMTNVTGSFESTYSMHHSNSFKSHRGKMTPLSDGNRTCHTDNGNERVRVRLDVRTLRQRAAAVTTAMISCAVGLACAENFIYVFFLTPDGGSKEEMVTLFFRSIFPVHATCAAIQSIGVINKFLEKDDNQNLWSIILPSVILHGSFDSVLMIISTFVDYAEENNDDIDDEEGGFENSIVQNMVALCAVIGALGVGIIWYFRKNRAQKSRLKAMENSEQISYVHSTSVHHVEGSQSELELL
jgi:RsiW-degrading membrane proteinase PrsW (M82 family)